MRQPKLPHEKCKSRLSPNKFQADSGLPYTTACGICIFTKFVHSMSIPKKGRRYSTETRILHCSIRFAWQIQYNTGIGKCQYLSEKFVFPKNNRLFADPYELPAVPSVFQAVNRSGNAPAAANESGGRIGVQRHHGSSSQ